MRISFVVLAVLFGATGCSFTKPPVVIERACPFAELNPKSPLPPVDFITPSEGCPYFRCLDEANAAKLKEREVLLRQDANYARELYLDTKGRCSRE